LPIIAAHSEFEGRSPNADCGVAEIFLEAAAFAFAGDGAFHAHCGFVPCASQPYPFEIYT
jgi:hypothetical protein